jgi:Na+-translocating ferredoxin:NAD+ oxidoreductase RnfD subunit
MLLICKILVADAILTGLLIALVVPLLHPRQIRKV